MDDTKRKYIAIYSRKSKYTGLGESTQNQIEMCINYITTKFGSEKEKYIKIYEDEGFSGANTNRPNFQQMINDLKSGTFSMLIVYKLDRISRNVLDFCSLKDTLSNLNVDFISITENFDTSTPIGRAMLMISSVFAQLERDTIAERIKDNMLELAKTGRWLGGTTPIGYKSKKIDQITIEQKKKSLYQLTINEKEIYKVKLIFSKYLEFKSISKLENYLKKMNIKTRNDIFFSRFALSNILRNIVYCKADSNIEQFLKRQNIFIFKNNLNFNSSNGLISYNKLFIRKNNNGKRKNIKRKMQDWIIAIGKHEGIIDGNDWISVCELLHKNSRHINC